MIIEGDWLKDDDRPTERVRCPIHGFIRYSKNERKVIDHPHFQRLRNIRQLAMTYLLYPGAVHTRFEHSLGVMEVATQAYDLLRLRHGNRMEQELRRVPELAGRPLQKARQVVRLFALLHDTGHPPFSHATERVLPGEDHEWCAT